MFKFVLIAIYLLSTPFGCFGQGGTPYDENALIGDHHNGQYYHFCKKISDNRYVYSREFQCPPGYQLLGPLDAIPTWIYPWPQPQSECRVNSECASGYCGKESAYPNARTICCPQNLGSTNSAVYYRGLWYCKGQPIGAPCYGDMCGFGIGLSCIGFDSDNGVAGRCGVLGPNSGIGSGNPL